MTSTTPRYAISYQRISSAKQIDGTGIDRQDKAAKRWAEDNGFTLLTGDWVDSGLSGWTGENRTVGALGRIIDGLRSGHIPPGTVLLIEQWDRLSREHRKKATRLIEDLLDDGLSIVTLNDGQVWSASEYDDDISLPIRLMLSLEQAHKFSENLSRRITAAWESNTEKVKAGTRLRSKAIPRWLRLVGTLDDGRFEVISEVAATVIEVFSRFADGEPSNAIATDLRNRDVPLISGRHSQWRSGNIRRIVSSKAPFGILEIGKGRKNDRTLTGEVVNDYFPRIVDEDIQRRVLFRLSKPNASGPIKGQAHKPTKAILTGLGWFKGERVARGVDTKGEGVYVTQVGRKYVGKQSYVERRFLEGWDQITAAADAMTTPEIENLEVAEGAFIDRLESAIGTGSQRLIAAAEADLEELREQIKDQRRATLWASKSVPEGLEGMAPDEANGILRAVIKEVMISKGKTARPKLGAPLWFSVHLLNGTQVEFGDFIEGDWAD